MNFDTSVANDDRRKIIKALQDIKLHGTALQNTTARFIEDSPITIKIGKTEIVRGSGSVLIDKILGANWAIMRGELSIKDSAKFIRLNIARETIDDGGQRGIEGTLVHEGKHALDFARMISTFSSGNERRFFNPTIFQTEYSAHLTSAFYLLRRGGEFALEGIDLGILYESDGRAIVNRKGIRARLRNNYRLTPETPGKRLSELSFPPILPRLEWLKNINFY